MVVAAAAGGTVETVEQALGTGALPAVQRAIEADLLASERGQLRFTHPLLAAESYAAADPAWPRRVHLRLASITSDVEEQARHLSAATELPDPAVAVRLDAGAAAAYARGAPAAAGVLAERALLLTSARDHEATVRRTIAAADYFWEVGASAKCLVPLQRLADQLPRGAEHADALRRLAAVTAVTGTFAAAKDLLDCAIAEGGDDPALLGALYSERAFDVMQAGDVRASQADAEAAVTFAARSGDPNLLADAETTRLLQAVIRADVSHDVRAQLRRLAALPDTGNRWVALASRSVLVAAMLKWLDDFDAARALLTAAYIDRWNRQLDGLLMPALFQLSELECWAGRLDRARASWPSWATTPSSAYNATASARCGCIRPPWPQHARADTRPPNSWPATASPSPNAPARAATECAPLPSSASSRSPTEMPPRPSGTWTASTSCSRTSATRIRP
jgi:hypothetical protein